ncbi:restriction endonuclease subunit S [Pectobacterium sp. LFLA-215]|uniref:restriction endonuclease subunit S n=1 Tax=Pectobacterium sp. LFLA-215 TaxID=3419008 RepID=UPI003F5C6B06
MENDWRSSNWGDEVTLEYGKAIRGYSQSHGKYRVFGSNGPIGWTSAALTQGPGVVLGRKGAYRGVEFCREPFWVIDTAYYIVPKTDLDMRWLYYAVKHYKLGEVDDGSPIPSTTRVAVYMLEFNVPPKHEQCAVAQILGTLDDRIELNRQANDTLEAMARTLFKAWFVDFEPVRAKMEGRWQRGQSLPSLPAYLYDLFPERLVESKLGEIPEGMEITSLSEYSSLNPESWTKRTRPEQIQYVDLSKTKWGRIESATSYGADDAPSRAQRILRPLDTIVGTVRPGNGSYALISDEGLTGSTGFAVLRPLRHECSEFVYLAATSRENIERLSNLADGGAYPAVRPEIVSATPVLRVGQELINAFSRQVSPMFAGMADSERTSQSLAQLRDTLLPKLISGEMRVQDAEHIVGVTI